MSVANAAPPTQAADTPQPHGANAHESSGSVTSLAGRTRRGRNVSRVGDRITESGVPSLQAWASCLSLGDLEAALRKAVA